MRFKKKIRGKRYIGASGRIETQINTKFDQIGISLCLVLE
jgi:hypothetical protein